MRAGARMAGAHQRPAPARVPLRVARSSRRSSDSSRLGDQLEVVAGDLQRGREPGRVRVELRAAAARCTRRRERAPDARRIERLHDAEHVGDLLRGVASISGCSVLRDFVERFGQVAIVADGVDDRAADRLLARRELRQLQLPEQVILQRLAGSIGEFLLALVVVAVPGCFGRACALLAPALVDHLDGVLGASGARLSCSG